MLHSDGDYQRKLTAAEWQSRIQGSRRQTLIVSVIGLRSGIKKATVSTTLHECEWYNSKVGWPCSKRQEWLLFSPSSIFLFSLHLAHTPALVSPSVSFPCPLLSKVQMISMPKYAKKKIEIETKVGDKYL